MNIGSTSKEPTAIKYVIFDFTCWLGQGEKLQSVVVSLTPETTPPLVAQTPILGFSKRTATIYFTGGVDATRYLVTLAVTTTFGQFQNFEYTIKVQE